MAASGQDRLSDLGDDLLRRVLHFAPLKEAASTTALSRRWCARPPLWLSSGAVNLETDIQQYTSQDYIPTIDAAPALTAVHLEHVCIDTTSEVVFSCPAAKAAPTTRLLRCPGATVLVLDSCAWKEMKMVCDRSGNRYMKNVDVHGVEIDMTRLRRFSDFLETFWRFAQNFTNAKEMKLRVNHLEDIAVLSEARRVELLPAFRRLERLEFQGVHSTKVKTAEVTTILNLLRCCPVLSALRINLTTELEDASNNEGVRTRTPQKEIQIAAMLGPRQLFPCLHNSLKRVGLQFQLDKSDCLGIKLIKFFAENAMVLEEMRIDGGDKKLSKHMNLKTEKWNSNIRKLRGTSFVFLPS